MKNPFIFLVAVFFLLVCSSAHGAAKKPNIVFMLVDDMGYGDLSGYGAPDAQTPNIDRLGTQGVKFIQFYAMGAECSPSRTAILTGRYPQRAGGLECAIGTGNVGRYDEAIRLAGKHALGLPASQAVLAPALAKAGYVNGAFGKWHMGYEPKFNPLRQGFDEFTGFLGGNVDYFTHTELSDLPVYLKGEKPIERKGYMTDLITDDSVSFIQRHKEESFFLYVPFSVPHFPFQGPHDDTGKMHPEDQFMIGTREKYVEMLEDMDRGVGRILAALDKNEVSDETLVVFASDHGAMKPGRNLPFNGWKGGLMEGGIRVPCMVRWPGEIKPGTVSNQQGSLMDLTASFLRVAGVKSPKRKKLDGIDILQHVQSGKADFDRTHFWRARRGDRTWKAVRDGDMKYVYKIEDGKMEEWLFDLSRDMGEKNDLKPSEAKELKRLRKLLAKWERNVKPVR
ncbi:MAG: arylsulfatase A-like enzyme [Limisphaerales bacterium]|jgi:arylsulfatase A-like enzyme